MKQQLYQFKPIKNSKRAIRAGLCRDSFGNFKDHTSFTITKAEDGEPLLTGHNPAVVYACRSRYLRHVGEKQLRKLFPKRSRDRFAFSPKS
jgi:hypothetical protein